MNSYDLSRKFFDWCFENPEKISPNHAAIYFFAVEHCNRLGWKEKFGFPTQMSMDALGIKKHQTFIKYFNDLIDFGFIKLIQKSTNQYSANIISLIGAMPKRGKALDKAFIDHAAKQSTSMGQSSGQSNSSIDKQETINKEQLTKNIIEFLNKQAKSKFHPTAKAHSKHIEARLKEGRTEDEFKIVITDRCKRWLNDAVMSEYLRPETLFGNKFDGYYSEAVKAGTKIENRAETDEVENNPLILALDPLVRTQMSWRDKIDYINSKQPQNA